LTAVNAGFLSGIGQLLSEFRLDRVIVHGDTTTTPATTLASYYARVSVVHVETGLRTVNTYSSRPEEVNRKPVTGIVDIHFSPTNRSVENLINEGGEGVSNLHYR
jgi:UDP-N-acetylglucosamine 2-epimerase (non-hydrolysing)